MSIEINCCLLLIDEGKTIDKNDLTCFLHEFNFTLTAAA